MRKDQTRGGDSTQLALTSAALDEFERIDLRRQFEGADAELTAGPWLVLEPGGPST